MAPTPLATTAFGAGQSRGGLTPKIHALTDADGLPVKLVITPGQTHDIQAAAELEEARWVSPQEIRSLTLAPLLANHILPRLCAPASA